MKYLLQKYPLTLLVLVAILYLSFFTPPSIPELENVRFIDKWTHMVMYGGLSGVILYEHLKLHGLRSFRLRTVHKRSLRWSHLRLITLWLPMLLGGVIEILQEYCTHHRRSGELLDFVADSLGSLLVFLLSLCLFSACVSDAVTERPAVRVGDEVPSFQIPCLDGSTFSTSQMRGRSYLIVFFSTTCADCQRQLPQVDQAYRQLGRADAVIAISRAEGAEVVAPFWQSQAFVMPVAPTADRTLYLRFAQQGVPRLYFVDAQGRITYMSDDSRTMSAAEILDYLNL